MGRSSDSRIILLTVPSPSFEEWHPYGFRPRSQRRVRNGFAPFSPKVLNGQPMDRFGHDYLFFSPGSQVKLGGHGALMSHLIQPIGNSKDI